MNLLDRMEIIGIETWAFHGVFDHERRDGQPFLVDLTWWLDMGQAADSDDLAKTVDYGEVTSMVINLLQGTPVDLIETLTYAIADTVITHFGFDYLRVSVHKPQAPLEVGFTDVIITTTAANEIHPREVVVSLGSNIEPRLDYLQYAVTALASTPGITEVRVSEVFETHPQSDVPQPDYLNAILIVTSILPAKDLMSRALDIESLCLRTREVPHGPRTLDIDLITIHGETWDDPFLRIPHPRAARRAFVLVPWLSLDPKGSLNERLISDCLVSLPNQGVHPTGLQLFVP
jgi:dihydroneopterin aldolase/2-amino-4-hydroxy-6-hydroxymethyldihydropteridine diphosphokinase